MTDPIDPQEVERVAKGLTKAQRNAIMAMQPGKWHPWRRRDTVVRRLSWGLRFPPLTTFSTNSPRYVTLLPLGEAVRARLEKDANHG
jgi:hypothetical protein